MNAIRERLLRGTRVHHDLRGRTLSFGAVSFIGLVEVVEPDKAPYEPHPDEQIHSLLHVVREELPAGVTVGSVIVDSAEGESYAVSKITDHRSNNCIVLGCRMFPT